MIRRIVENRIETSERKKKAKMKSSGNIQPPASAARFTTLLTTIAALAFSFVGHAATVTGNIIDSGFGVSDRTIRFYPQSTPQAITWNGTNYTVMDIAKQANTTNGAWSATFVGGIYLADFGTVNNGIKTPTVKFLVPPADTNTYNFNTCAGWATNLPTFTWTNLAMSTIQAGTNIVIYTNGAYLVINSTASGGGGGGTTYTNNTGLPGVIANNGIGTNLSSLATVTQLGTVGANDTNYVNQVTANMVSFGNYWTQTAPFGTNYWLLTNAPDTSFNGLYYFNTNSGNDLLFTNATRYLWNYTYVAYPYWSLQFIPTNDYTLASSAYLCRTHSSYFPFGPWKDSNSAPTSMAGYAARVVINGDGTGISNVLASLLIGTVTLPITSTTISAVLSSNWPATPLFNAGSYAPTYSVDYTGSGSSLEDLPINHDALIPACPLPPIVLTTYNNGPRAAAGTQDENYTTNLAAQVAASGLVSVLTNTGVPLFLHMDATTRFWQTNRSASGQLQINTAAFPDGSYFASVVHGYGFKLEGTVYAYAVPSANTVQFDASGSLNPTTNSMPAMTPNTVWQDVAKFYDFGLDGVRISNTDAINTGGAGKQALFSRMVAENVLLPAIGLTNKTPYGYAKSLGGRGLAVPLMIESLYNSPDNTAALVYQQNNCVGFDLTGSGWAGQITNAPNYAVQIGSNLRGLMKFENQYLGKGLYGQADLTYGFFQQDFPQLQTRYMLSAAALDLGLINFSYPVEITNFVGSMPNFLANITNATFLAGRTDPLVNRAFWLFDNGPTNTSALARRLDGGRYLVGLFNETGNQTNITVPFGLLGANSNQLYQVTSAWDTNLNLGSYTNLFTYTNTPALGTALLLLTPATVAAVTQTSWSVANITNAGNLAYSNSLVLANISDAGTAAAQSTNTLVAQAVAAVTTLPSGSNLTNAVLVTTGILSTETASTNTYAGHYFQNTSSGGNASGKIGVYSDAGNPTNFFFTAGVNSSGFTNKTLVPLGPNMAFLLWGGNYTNASNTTNTTSLSMVGLQTNSTIQISVGNGGLSTNAFITSTGILLSAGNQYIGNSFVLNSTNPLSQVTLTNDQHTAGEFDVYVAGSTGTNLALQAFPSGNVTLPKGQLSVIYGNSSVSNFSTTGTTLLGNTYITNGGGFYVGAQPIDGTANRGLSISTNGIIQAAGSPVFGLGQASGASVNIGNGFYIIGAGNGLFVLSSTATMLDWGNKTYLYADAYHFWVNTNFAAPSITATNGVYLPQLAAIPTNVIPAGASSITNWLQCNLNGTVYLVATNYAAGGWLYSKQTATITTTP